MPLAQLELLMSAYYHQDWVDLGMWQTLDLYVADSTVTELDDLIRDVDRVLASLAESEIKDLLRRSYHCAVDPTMTYGGYRPWLEEIDRRVRSALRR